MRPTNITNDGTNPRAARSSACAALLLGFFLTCGPMLFSQSASSIEGQVVNAVTGAPLRNANVMLRQMAGVPPQAGQPAQFRTYAAHTNEQGRFGFRGLPPGGYQIAVQRQGYLDTNYRQTGRSSDPLWLGEDQQLAGVVVRVRPQSVIAGKVLDSDGEPAAGVQMSARQWSYENGRRQLTPVTGTTGQPTNDIGEYRIAGLPPGEYLVMADPPRRGYSTMQSGAIDSMPDEPQSTYVSTYYPAVTDETAAKPVAVTMGAEVRGIDIKLARGRAFRIRGRVIDKGATGNMRPMVTIRPRGDSVYPGSGRMSYSGTDIGGSFAITDVLPGSYYLVAQRTDGQATVSGVQNIEVTDKNLDGITLELSPFVDIQGVVSLNASRCGGTYVTLSPQVAPMMASQPQAAVAADASFTLKNVALGTYTLNVSGNMCFVQSVRFNGREVSGTTLTVYGPGSLEIALAFSNAVVEGSVSDSAGKPVSRGVVTFSPKAGSPSGFRSMSIRPDGMFQLSGLPPGAYDVFAWEGVNYAAAQSVEYRKQFESSAKAIVVEENSRVTVQLTAIPAAATSDPGQAPPAAKGAIEGRVLNTGTGAPVAGAAVMLGRQPVMRLGMGPLRPGGSLIGNGGFRLPADKTVEADEQGRFTIPDIEPGVYYIAANRRGFYSPGAWNPNTMGEPIIVGEGQRITGFSIRLMPQGVAAGKVSDEYGEAVQNAEVMLYRSERTRGVRRLARIAASRTDDLGQFRMANLGPGRYYLSAALRSQPRTLPTAPTTAPDEPETGYGMVWYPNAPEFGGASPLEVRGAETPNINLVLRRTKVVRVRGTVSGPDGEANQRPSIGLTPKGLGVAIPTTGNVMIGRDGAFEISNVPPGSYILSARSVDVGASRMAVLPLEVRDANIDGVRMELSAGREVRGVVRMEGGGQGYARVTLYSAEGLNSPTANAVQNGTFKLQGVLPIVYSVDVASGCSSCYVKSIRCGGRDVPEGGIEFTGDGQLEIVLSAAGAVLQGTAVDRQGRPVNRAAVFVAPAGGQGEIRTGTTDARGGFYFEGLRPGAYQVFAWQSAAPDASPEALAPFKSEAKAVTLGENARETVQVTAR